MGHFDIRYMLIGCNTTIICPKCEKKTFFYFEYIHKFVFLALLQVVVVWNEPEFLTFNLNNAQL